MRSQLDLQDLFLTITQNVYFQPPATLKMTYPCIVYQRDDIDVKRSNDKVYGSIVKYLVTVIDPNPNSELVEKVLLLPLCGFERHYTKDNLNHDIYNLYY